MQSQNSHMNSRKVCRSSKEKVLCGVCGGLAAYWDVSVFWVRIAALVAFVMWFPLSILVYFVCCWMMPKPDWSGHTGQYRSAANQTAGPGPVRRSPAEAFQFVNDQFDAMESRICFMEDKVTSKEFILNKKFESL